MDTNFLVKLTRFVDCGHLVDPLSEGDQGNDSEKVDPGQGDPDHAREDDFWPWSTSPSSNQVRDQTNSQNNDRFSVFTSPNSLPFSPRVAISHFKSKSHFQRFVHARKLSNSKALKTLQPFGFGQLKDCFHPPVYRSCEEPHMSNIN